MEIENISQLLRHPKVVCHMFDYFCEDLFNDVAGYVWLRLEPGCWDDEVEDFVEDYPVAGPAWIFKITRGDDGGLIMEDTRHNKQVCSFRELSRLLTERQKELELLLFEEEDEE